MVYNDKRIFNVQLSLTFISICFQPKGGVKKGEIFQSPVLNLDSTSVFDPTGRTKRLTDMHTPDNQWRSGFFNIFAHGILHPMTINSFLCTHGEFYALTQLIPTNMNYLISSICDILCCSESGSSND